MLGKWDQNRWALGIGSIPSTSLSVLSIKLKYNDCCWCFQTKSVVPSSLQIGTWGVACFDSLIALQVMYLRWRSCALSSTARIVPQNQPELGLRTQLLDTACSGSHCDAACDAWWSTCWCWLLTGSLVFATSISSMEKPMDVHHKYHQYIHEYHQSSSISSIFININQPMDILFHWCTKKYGICWFGYHQWKKCPSQTQQTLLSPDPAGSITTSGGRGSCWGQQRPLSTGIPMTNLPLHRKILSL